MPFTEPVRLAPGTTRGHGARVAVVLVLLTAALVLGRHWAAGAPPAGSSRPPTGQAPPAPPRAGADGAIPDGTTVFDVGVPGVAKLDPQLLRALQRAASAAASDGVELRVDSGWRSPAYQQRLLDGAIAKYGSEAAARRWVATPQTSAHVSGHAVDMGPAEGAAWLSANGARHDLCQVYANEPWHYELRANASARGCPGTYADAAHDPRTRRR